MKAKVPELTGGGGWQGEGKRDIIGEFFAQNDQGRFDFTGLDWKMRTFVDSGRVLGFAPHFPGA